jgi:hypothetical protein
VVLLFSALAIILFAPPSNSLAADTNGKLENVKTLKQNTVYKYDLNGDGKVESIQYKVSVKEAQHTATLKLYINKKLCLTKEEDGLSFRIYLLDLNQSDNYMDLFIHTVLESDCADDAFFVQYNGSKLFHTTAFTPKDLTKDFNIYRYSLSGTDGKGNFTFKIDTPVFSPSIGCYFSFISFQLKDEKISLTSAKTFTLSKDSKTYRYEAAKTISAYKTAGSKSVAYKVKRGDTVIFDKMYLSKTGKVYFRMINDKKQMGWIRSDLDNLFAELPLWG